MANEDNLIFNIIMDTDSDDSEISDSNEARYLKVANKKQFSHPNDHESEDSDVEIHESAENNEISDKAVKLKNTKTKIYSQKIRDEWFKDDRLKHWLVRIEKSSTKLSCKFCKKVLLAKKFDLIRHAISKTHIAAEKPFSDNRQTKIELKIKKIANNQLEAALCMYVACHQSILPIGHLSAILNSRCGLASEIKMKRSKCTNILQNVLAAHFKNELKNDIKNSWYSILIDESNDISVTKMLGVAIIYYSKNYSKIVSTYLGLCELPACDAQSIVDALKNLLCSFKIKLNNMAGIGTDNAAVMVGVNNGVFAILKKEIPGLILIRCTCHSLVLALHHATKTLPTELEFLLRETYNWFSHSSLRLYKYKNLYRLINDNIDLINIPRICDTRWLSMEKSVSVILNQWLELKTCFDIERTTCKSAEILSKMFANPMYKLYLIFLQPIIKEVCNVNLAFQSKTSDPSKLLKDIVNLLQSLTKKIVYNHTYNVLTMQIENFIDWSSKLGFYFETEIQKLCIEEQLQIRGRCITFIKNLINEIKNRLPDNIQVLQKINVISIENVLNRNKESIVPILKMFIIDPMLITEIEFQFLNMDTKIWHSKTTTDLWIEVIKYRDSAGLNPFGDLSEFAIKLLSLPHSNADIERAFSQMNLVKNKYRNRMQLCTLNSILLIRFGLKICNKCCSDYILPPEIFHKIGTMSSYSKDDDEDEAGSQDMEDFLLNTIQ